jgi:hypothetical protein
MKKFILVSNVLRVTVVLKHLLEQAISFHIQQSILVKNNSREIPAKRHSSGNAIVVFHLDHTSGTLSRHTVSSGIASFPE